MHHSTRTRVGVFTSLLGATSLALALVAPGVGATPEGDAPGTSGTTPAAEHRQDGRAASAGGGTGTDGTSGGRDGEATAQGRPDDPGSHGRDRATQAQEGNGNGDGNAATGNRGTVKIKTPGEDAFPPANRPHPGCDFEVHVYNAPSTGASLEFTLHPPTAGPSVTRSISGLTVAEPGDGLVHSGYEAFNLVALFGSALDGVEPHPQHGYHVKLTLTWDDGPQAPGNRKHKVFWLDCRDEGGVAERPEVRDERQVRDEREQPLVTGSDVTPLAMAPQVLPGSITAPEAGPEVAPQVLPGSITAPQPATEVAPQVLGVEERRQLPVTGSALSALMVLAGVVLLAGGTMLTAESQLHARRRPARSRV